MPELKSGLVVPAHVAALMESDKPKAVEADEPDAKKASAVPKPTGYHILLTLIEADDKFESGLIKADITKTIEEVANVVGFVVAMGPDCYKGRDSNGDLKFPSGPWCKDGDFVIVRAYSGTRLKIHGKEFRLINDQQVEAVVEDPRGISRI